ncbi:TonB-dependent receptor [Pseudomaricurvus alkylphenolicus]|uniref:TonB-dependent receptor n=1 Tax=Pseudomaricurvus alkylphenolicus TaxID=1306991 RepID=UPI00141DF1E3|nr:TonB-dependent receptor [Pseudomaricurvus alkylphenolicus]NIB43438.1 TonB-dependent receptor [Pseudomaricurvus alkylphenolicus]
MRYTPITTLSAMFITALGMQQASAVAIEEITVTAQKREQSLQDVSTAVTALTSDRLSDAGVSDIKALQNFAPSVTIGTTFGYANLFMRGLGLNTVFANVDPSVTMYVDGAVISQPGAQLFSFFDLERAEVLRGPQGSLYGRNATGGTINLIAKKPTEELTGDLKLTLGNYDLVQTEAAVGGAITDQVQGRISLHSTQRGGYGKNEVTGSDISDSDRQALRAQLAIQVSEDVDLYVAAEYGRENDASNAFLYKRETFLGDDLPTNAVANGIGGFAGGARNYASDVDPVNDRTTASLSLTLDWALAENWDLKNILNARHTDMLNIQDLDASAVINSTIQEFVFESEQISEELQLSFSGESLRAIAGLYYFKEELYHENNVGGVAEGGLYVNPYNGQAEKRVNLTGEGEVESWAVFWNASYDLSEQLSLKLGGRYTHDERQILNDNVIWAGPTRLSVMDANLPLFQDKGRFSDYTNEAGLEWHANADTLVYYTYSEGFKAGTGQLGANAANIIEPESIINHELGLKTTLADGSLVINAALYRYEVDDIQLDRTLVGGPTGFTTVFENATTQKAQGLELEAFWAATERLRMNASVSIMDTEFGSFLTVDPTNVENVGGEVLVDIKGNSARQSPDLAWNLHAEYDIPLNGGGQFTLGLDVSFKDKHYFSEFNNLLLNQDHYTLYDLTLKYTSADESWSLLAWGRNLGDELVEGGNYALASGRVTTRTLLPPRTSGLTLNYSF